MPPSHRPPLSGPNSTPVVPRPRVPLPAPSRPSLGYMPPVNPNFYQYQSQARVSQNTLTDIRTKPVKRPSPSPTVSPGQAINPTTIPHYPPPNHGQSPQLSFPPYPQSFWSTPPPGEGHQQPPHSAGLTGARRQQGELPGTTTQAAGLSETSTQPVGFRGPSLQSTGFSEYESTEGHYRGWSQ